MCARASIAGIAQGWALALLTMPPVEFTGKIERCRIRNDVAGEFHTGDQVTYRLLWAVIPALVMGPFKFDGNEYTERSRPHPWLESDCADSRCA
jgi:hypothetical protein